MESQNENDSQSFGVDIGAEHVKSTPNDEESGSLGTPGAVQGEGRGETFVRITSAGAPIHSILTSI